MVSPLHEAVDSLNLLIRHNIILIICQALLYGIYLCLFPITVHAMVTNGLQSRARKWVLATITFLFALITAYWIFSGVLTFLTIGSLDNILTTCYASDNGRDAVACMAHGMEAAFHQSAWFKPRMFDDLLLVNFFIADGVVVWRAWVLCSDLRKVVLMTPVIMLVINTVIYFGMAVVTTIQVITDDFQFFSDLASIADIIEVIQLTLSLIINIYATSIIALKAWKYRKLLMENGIGIRTPRQATKILALLVESGVIYILIGVISLAPIAIFREHSIAPTILLVGVHLAGIYPIVVVLLVEKNRSLSTTYCSFSTISDVQGNRPSQGERMIFVPGPVLASGGEIAPGIKLYNHDTDN